MTFLIVLLLALCAAPVLLFAAFYALLYLSDDALTDDEKAERAAELS